MITFSGKLARAGYWKQLGLTMLGLVVISGALLWLLDIQDAEVAKASMQNQALAIIFGSLYLINLGFFFFMLLSAIFRRAHDIGNSTIWIITALFIPFGLFIIGLVPSRS